MAESWKVKKYADIHTHVLFGVDDGPDTIDESMEMIRRAYEGGVRFMIATPHYGMWGVKFDKQKADANFKALRQRIASEYKDFVLGLGNEIFYSRGAVEDLVAGKARTMAGTDYVLVEFSPGLSEREIKDGLHNLIQSGYRPILAHAERYRELQDDQEAIEDLIRMGVYIQINANSLLGRRLDTRTRMCRNLLKNDLVHFIASDCHNNDSRKPNIDKTLDKVIKIIGEEKAKKILQANPVAMIKNEFL